MIATRAVVLARGLGTRMRVAEAAAPLDPAQAAMADAGMKAMVPVADGGRPFLDYILSGLADAGFTEAILVIGPEHAVVRERYGALGPVKPTRIRPMYAVQTRPTGTADALRAAEMLLPGAPFVVLNGDNYYPVSVLAQLRQMAPLVLPAFDAAALVAGGIPAERIASYATLEIRDDGTLRRIREKPGEGGGGGRGGEAGGAEAGAGPGSPGTAAGGVEPGARMSMNLWLFDKQIFEACREVPLSRRGERELPEAVQWLIDRRGTDIHTFPVAAPVLDLSRRADVAAVSRALAGVEVRV